MRTPTLLLGLAFLLAGCGTDEAYRQSDESSYAASVPMGCSRIQADPIDILAYGSVLEDTNLVNVHQCANDEVPEVLIILKHVSGTDGVDTYVRARFVVRKRGVEKPILDISSTSVWDAKKESFKDALMRAVKKDQRLYIAKIGTARF
jgi:hypothetical protein